MKFLRVKGVMAAYKSQDEWFDLIRHCTFEQEVEEQYLVEVLECLFHHILFHRSLGLFLSCVSF